MLRFGSLALWLFGALALWFFGSLVLWLFGSLALWFFGSLALWLDFPPSAVPCCVCCHGLLPFFVPDVFVHFCGMRCGLLSLRRSLCTVFVALCSVQAEFTTPIEHVVVLMLENRAFDHMAGFFPGVNGLRGDEFNPFNTSNLTNGGVTVTKNSPYISPIDPDHSTPGTTAKIFGQDCLLKNKTNPGSCNTPTMDGFVERALKNGHSVRDASKLMDMFTPERLPIMSTLASEFAIFDRFFASHPVGNLISTPLALSLSPSRFLH